MSSSQLGACAVLDEQGDGTADGHAVAHASEEARAVELDAHAPAAAVPLLPAGKVTIDILGEERHAGGHPLEDADERGAVALLDAVA